jgi:alginate O-acetyltransferase complex protein AlgI
MAFDSLEYLLLLLGTLVIYSELGPRGRLLLLIASSIVFYAAWSVPLLSLIVLSAIIDFTVALLIQGSTNERARRVYLWVSLLVNLGLLGYFKYAGFFAENLAALLGHPDTARLDVVLPPAISFYTFQTMSYSIDVYRGQARATRSFGRFFLYVCFFPQLIAGPIERAKDLLGQFGLAFAQRVSLANIISGARMIAWGMFKKVVIANYCGGLADKVYSAPGDFDGWAALVATYAFTLQIYCDFSAYSEMARGSARMFGVELMQNFDQPYLTTNIRDFWRRWHISLSNWFRDYVYLGLGGNRSGRVRTLMNLAITMLLSGLWHGAAWNFVLWGAYHGGLLLATTLIAGTAGFRRLSARWGGLGRFLAWFLNFHLVVFGWVLFRVDAIRDVPILLSAMAQTVRAGALPTLAQAGFLLAVAGLLALSYLRRRGAWFDQIHRDRSASLLFYTTVVVLTVLLARGDGPQFIYFQF